MAKSQHPLDLPEILFRIIWYLDAKDVAACLLVCRTFYSSFTPYVWETIHLGSSPEQQRIIRSQDPLARFISFEPFASNDQEQGQQEPSSSSQEDELLQVLRKIASWIRSLSIHGHHSPRQLLLGEHCTKLESLSMGGLPYNRRFDQRYATTCKMLVEQNAASLRSLSLTKWQTVHKNHWLAPPWNPILICAPHKNLRSLSITAGKIGKRHWAAFWQICRHVETLELKHMYLPLSSRKANCTMESGGGGGGGNRNTHGGSRKSMIPDIQFPKLRELTLERIHHAEPLDQLNRFISHCPMLQTLMWTLPWDALLPTRQFCEAFSAMTWPELDSITIKDHRNSVKDAEHIAILRAAKKPFKFLDLKLIQLEPPTFDLLRQYHFKTLFKVNLTLAQDLISDPWMFSATGGPKWVQEVLESCPMLEHIVAKIITATEIVNGKSWTCHRLKVFQVMIDMEFKDKASERGSKRPHFTEAEVRQSHEVFRQLGQLKQLKVLDLRYSGFRKTVQLPLELRMGLAQLSDLKDMEMVGFIGSLDLRMVDLEWMLQHWPCLKRMLRGRLSNKRSKSFGNKFVRDYLFMQMLDSRGIQTGRRWEDDDSQVKILMRRNCIEAVYDSESESESESE